MAKTLRQHVERAERILSILGVRTLLPQKGRPAPIRNDASDLDREYAVSIRVVLWRCDRTGYATEWLTSSDDVAGAVWNSIPEWYVCPLCMGRVPEERIGKGRVYCVPCGTFVHPKQLRGLVAADIRKMRKQLREGEIGCE